MKNILLPALLTAAIASLSVMVIGNKAPSAPSLSITPQTIVQGDPVMISVVGATSTIKSATVTAPSRTTTLHFAPYKNQPTAFYGASINQKTGTAKVVVTLVNGTTLSGTFTIAPRTRPSEDFPVPASEGGNSTSSQQHLVTNLATDNATLADVYYNPTATYWTSAFAFPVSAPVVTDTYGYERASGLQTIIHKGTDFRAPPGTAVYAINDGVVRLVKTFTVYGNTIVIDHGVGIESFYMHLSKMSVSVGDKVTKGELIGYSGETGYAEGPHLHLTIRINGVSIDPMKFYALFGVQ